MSALDDAYAKMEAAVTKAEGTAASAKTLIVEFAKYVKANAGNPAAITAFADRLVASQDPLAEAVAANPDPDTTD